jgi:hypothetical protein
VRMDEARKVIERLERIDALQRAAAPAEALLAEVRALLREGEAWLAAERGSTDDAQTALERCRGRLDVGEGVGPEETEEAVL